MTSNPASTPELTSTTTEAALLDAILNRSPVTHPNPPTGLPMVGDCLEGRHPTLLGRYLIRYPDGTGEPVDRWLASLYGLPVRAHDRVLLLQPGNWPEPVVIGVVDGFATRPGAPSTTAATLELQQDEVVRINGCRGEPLVEVRQHESGPLVRLLSEDINLELPGKLKLTAKSIELEATQGGVKIAASDDVTVKGEMIQLN
ncbi:MAG TPA: hypothetical protein VG122_14050 [Gemmata sp.]|nr:hypothetical protein [Gemmata sp.]